MDRVNLVRPAARNQILPCRTVISMSSPVVIASRFAGPPGSANGGYAAGRLAAFQDDPVVAVTLRRPPPLQVPLDVEATQSAATLTADGVLVAEARPASLRHHPVEAVDIDAARAAERGYRGRTRHPFPRCFVCGPDRAPGDGLRLFAGPVDNSRTACTWTPDASLTDPTATTMVAAGEPGAATVVGSEFVWAALDCPGGWTSDLESRPMVLGSITAEVGSRPRVCETYVVVGGLIGVDGRKTYTATALYDQAGLLLARAEQIWVTVDPATFGG